MYRCSKGRYLRGGGRRERGVGACSGGIRGEAGGRSRGEEAAQGRNSNAHFHCA